MKIRVLIIIFLVFISCKKPVDKEFQTDQVVIDSTDLKIESDRKQKDLKESTLKFKKLSEVIDSTFDVKNAELKEVHKPWKKEYYSLIDSTNIKSFQKYSEFLIIEFHDSKNSISEFDKIKAIAEKSISNKKELFPYYHVFRKGGVSFFRIDKWIIIHFLRCNMYPKEYDIEKQFTTEFENLNFEVNLIRMRCGWAKAEFN